MSRPSGAPNRQGASPRAGYPPMRTSRRASPAARGAPASSARDLSCRRVVETHASGDALPEPDRGPLVEEAHGQGHASPALDGAHDRVRAVDPVLAATVVLVAGEDS